MQSPALDWLPSTSASVLEAALAYARHIGRVIPVHGIHDGRCTCGAAPGECKPGKHPVGGSWQKRASADEDAVRVLFRRAPRPCNVGLVMGEQPGGSYLVAIDVDGDVGRAKLAEVGTRAGPLPATLTSRSGRIDGGEHRIFALGPNQDPKRLTNRANGGLDVRAKGGQIVACPSLHEAGNRYSWANTDPIAVLPDAWFEEIAAPLSKPRSSRPPSNNIYSFNEPYVRAVLDNAERDIASQLPGGRNQCLFAKTCTVLEYCSGHGVSWQLALDRLRQAGVNCGLSKREVNDTLRKASRQVESSGKTRHAPPMSEPASTGVHATVNEPEDDELVDEWRSRLTIDRGRYEDCLANVITILSCHPSWKDVLRYDLFRETIVFTREPPCRDSDRPSSRTQGDVWTEGDDTRTRAWVRSVMGFEPAQATVAAAVAVVAERTAIHPVRDYLNGLTWDGEERLLTFLANYFGASPNAYTAGIGTKWMISAVARVMKPGCEVHYMLVFEGLQGLGKSTGVRALMPRSEWFSDTGITIGQKDSYMTMHGLWIYGFDELDSIRGSDITKTKNFLSSPSDRLRPPYGRRMRNFPRQTIFVGTTNEEEYLRDRTGNRRFWPVACARIDVDAVGRDRDQLWAEARVRFERGEKWWPDAQLNVLCKEQQEERTVADPWVSIVDDWLRTEQAKGIIAQHGGLLTRDLLITAIGKPARDIQRTDEMRAGEVLRSLGFTKAIRSREGGEVCRRYIHPRMDQSA